jgi:purine nucleoside phosphorylase
MKTRLGIKESVTLILSQPNSKQERITIIGGSGITQIIRSKKHGE